MNNHRSLRSAADIGEALLSLADDQSAWSQATFGDDIERGPIGPLKHLEKEAREAQENPTDRMEYADCLILLLDASRRAGMTPMCLVRAAQKKMIVNRGRQWGKPVADEAVEHVRK
jgi:ParB family chromosome partitioning protein